MSAIAMRPLLLRNYSVVPHVVFHENVHRFVKVNCPGAALLFGKLAGSFSVPHIKTSACRGRVQIAGYASRPQIIRADIARATGLFLQPTSLDLGEINNMTPNNACAQRCLLAHQSWILSPQIRPGLCHPLTIANIILRKSFASMGSISRCKDFRDLRLASDDQRPRKPSFANTSPPCYALRCILEISLVISPHSPKLQLSDRVNVLLFTNSPTFHRPKPTESTKFLNIL